MQNIHATLADCTTVSFYFKRSEHDRSAETYNSAVSLNPGVISTQSAATGATVTARPRLPKSGKKAETMRFVGDSEPGSVHAEI